MQTSTQRWVASVEGAGSLETPGYELFDELPEYTNFFLAGFVDDNGAGSMLVAPGEHTSALTTGNAAAAHHATVHDPDPIAPSPDDDDADDAAMEVATADAPSVPPPPTGLAPADNAALLDPAGSTFAMPPVTATTMPSLDAPISLSADMHIDPLAAGYAMDGGMPLNGYSNATTAEQQLSAFARLRFDDGSYYMHTYQIILGRNVHLAHKDMRRLAKVEQLQAKGEQQRAQALLHGHRKRPAGARSVISEAGGIVNAPIEMMPMEYQQRRQSVASHSLASSGSQPKAENGQEPDHAPQEMLMQAFPEAPDTFDSHVPEDPNDCPIVPIHPQHITDRTGLRGPKGISRQHAKIFYDFDNGQFCLAVMGSNGLYHEDTFLPKGTCVELNHGDTITIGMVEMSFFLPDIALTEEQRNRQESGSQSRPMSFSFENGQGESEDMDDSASEDMSVNPRHVYHYPVGSDLESEDDAMAEDDNMDDLEDEYSPAPRPKPSLKLKLKNKHQAPPPKPSKHKHGHTNGPKRKAAREASPDEPPPPKKAKHKVKESHKELPKEKERSKASKIPAKQPGKAPAKSPKDETPKVLSPPKDQTTEPTPPVALGSPVAARIPAAAAADAQLELGEGTISAEVIAKYGLPESLIGQQLPTRKGPGRPPKDGLMSKRQRSQLIKQGKEIEKARAAGIDPADLPQPIVKPKIARRKESIAGEEDDIRESTEKGDGLGTPGEKKQPKPAKPARTPSPEMRVEDYTEEQLQRPTSNYVVLIHEAISSAPTGQMNLQQIYNYIEKNYPWYKFKTTTSGWQSSVRHNLGQHDAFVKGDKEGKGYMWRINANVSIEKERRKRQVSPPQVNSAQRQGYYPPTNAYPPYGQPGYYQGMPSHGLPPSGTPRPPPSVEPVQPRLPPSMARASSSTAPAAPQSVPAPSPYASPWAGGNPAGSPPSQMPPRPYPQPTSQTPPMSSAAPPSGQYGVLYPTTAPPATSAMFTAPGGYGSPYATAGPSPSPYSATPGRPYTPYPPPGPPPHSYSGAPSAPGYVAHAQHVQGHPPHGQNDAPTIPHPSGRYPLSTNPDLIRQLEAFRTVYLQTRIEPGEDAKVDNAIKAYVTPDLASTLTPQEQNLLASIKTIPTLEGLRITHQPIKQEDGTQRNDAPTPPNADAQATPAVTATTTVTATATAAAIAADAAANTVPSNSTATAPSSEPQKFTPNMTGPSTPAADPPFPIATPNLVQTQRPSVEPLTPVPGSPAVQSGTPLKRSMAEVTTSVAEDTASGAQRKSKSPDASSPVEAPKKDEV